MGEVSVDVKADTNAAVNAPVLTGNNITGAVNFFYTSNTAEQQNCTETSKKNTQEQALQEFLRSHKINMKEDSESIFEGKKENEADLKDIYTDLFITEGDMKEVNREREILNIDDAFRNTTKTSQDKHIKCNEIFQSLKTKKKKKKKIILTKGVAGIGKTVSVQKLILDWAEGTDTANQDIDAMFVFPFREINQIKDKHISFHEFLLEFYPDMEKLEKTSVMKLTEGNVAFIFDGLDESRLSLDFKCRNLRSVEERSSVDEMIINLIRRDLLPSSLIWITSRPAAANQIPPEFVGLLTEVRGFTDQQKEEYFIKRFKDKSQADEMIRQIKKSPSLYIMCHIPVFCWITYTVLHDILIQNNEGNIDTTLTEMYIHFLLIQMNMKNQKYDEKNEEDYTKLLESNKPIVLKLSKLAFEQLKKENIIFYENDLKQCDIDMSEDSEYTGMIAEIFKKEYGLHKRKVFSFIHLSVQEFLAALHVFICYMTNNKKDLEFFNTSVRARKITLNVILKKAIDKATESKRGHLDLFLRFLMGISLESSQKLLEGLLTRTEDTTDSITDTTQYIKRLQDKRISDEASVNLFYCLLELKDKSLNERIEKYLHPDESDSVIKLSDSMCTLMIYVLLMSENVLDEFNMNRYDTSDKKRLVPAVRCCGRALLSGCDLTAESCEVVASAFQSSECPLSELDMSNNDLKDSGVKLIFDALKTHNCQLHTLRLARCNLTDECCVSLSSCLQSSKSLIELDLSNNDLKDSGVKLISDALKTHNCQLHILRLSGCNLTDDCCESLSSCLQSSNSLRELDLSNNDLKDSGVKLISDALKTHNCQLHTLRLSGCMVTVEGCCYLATALSSNPSHLRELDLSYNHPQHSARQLLSDRLNDPNYTLNKLNVDHEGERRITAGPRKWVCDLTLDPNTANTKLILSEENTKITCVRERQSYPDHPDRFDRPQVLCRESLTGRCYWETDWSGSCSISVSYESINRKGRSHDSLFGYNVKSWSLECSDNRITALHNKNKTDIRVSSGVCKRVGVYVDCSAGTLSFYSVSDTHTLTHLHTFNTTFTEPLYAGFRVYGSNSSVSV
ncbi:LOW QUALITY PROTEIN: NACHT, LRR and PYD domains-containing protein 3-like [Triplophysa dalaica]|uniref:LOW QUALITY PROTEIN: NACHT, LRR and PYD domains-containing protein 3-like n=1 Tax=Triplophysa dalaica TaxID=1582913 RepID=UPI0024E03926|nr:LOW QUALITY PROTEIN: NACHT, LRR and PYD domains-containing protein 3-like [Triplophysa dalaica]